jgi:biopolymer transport protein ExbB
MGRPIGTSLMCGLLCAVAFVVTNTGSWTFPVGTSAASAAEAAKKAGGEAPPANAADVTAGEKNLLVWTYESLGLMYTLIFLAFSFSSVALVVMNILRARRDSICPQHLVEAFGEHLAAKRYQEAYELARADESVLGQVLAAGMAKVSVGYDKAVEAMQEVGEDENMKIEHQLSYLGLLGTVSPMVGLFGTVHGMIMSFEVIASSNTTPKPSKLAEGVSTALFTTIVGLAIAIPVIACFHYFKNRFIRLMFEVGVYSGELMSHFEPRTPQNP